jgi:hypothetical protein
MQMGLEILSLKKATEYASFRMLMGISWKDLAGIYKSITFHKIKGAEGFNFLRKGGVTYVTRQGVTNRESFRFL